MAKKWDATFLEYLSKTETEFGLPANLLDVMTLVESDRGLKTSGDKDKSLGVFQIHTGEKHGMQDLNDNVPEFATFEPGISKKTGARAAAAFLKFNDTQYLKSSDGNIVLMLGAYNGGGGNVERYGLEGKNDNGRIYDYVAKYVAASVAEGYGDLTDRLLSDAAKAAPERVNLSRLYAVSFVKLADKEDKMALQEVLKEAGLYKGEIDGKIGPASRAAIADLAPESFEAIRTLFEAKRAELSGQPVISKPAAVTAPADVVAPKTNMVADSGTLRVAVQKAEVALAAPKTGLQPLVDEAYARASVGGSAVNQHWAITRDIEVVKAVQEALGVTADGKFGLQTARALARVTGGDELLSADEVKGLLTPSAQVAQVSKAPSKS